MKGEGQQHQGTFAMFTRRCHGMFVNVYRRKVSMSFPTPTYSLIMNTSGLTNSYHRTVFLPAGNPQGYRGSRSTQRLAKIFRAKYSCCCVHVRVSHQESRPGACSRRLGRIPRLFFFFLLHARQHVTRFSIEVRPPYFQGKTWSMFAVLESKSVPQYLQRKLSRSRTFILKPK